MPGYTTIIKVAIYEWWRMQDARRKERP